MGGRRALYSVAVGTSPNRVVSAGVTRTDDILNRITTISATVLYVVALQVVYVHIIAPRFGYLGYTARTLPIVVVFAASLLAMLPASWLPLRLRRPSQIVYWALYLITYVPTVIVPFYVLRLPVSELMRYAAVLFMALSVLGLIYRLPLLRVRRPALPRQLYWGLIGLLTLGAIGIVLESFGVPRSLPSLASIYEVREDYRAELQAGGRLVALSITWLVNIVGPLLLAVGLVWRRWRPAAIGVGVELLAFAVTGYKSALLAPAAIVAVYVLIRYGSQMLGSVLSIGAVALVGTAVFLDAITNQIILTSWLVRRLLVTPGLVAGRFFEFFSENGFAHLGHSVLAGIIQPPYALSPPELIGLAYDGRIYSANANFWADGFANYGVTGILLATLVVAVVAYFTDSVSNRLASPNRQVITLLLIQPAITLSNSAVITSLVTHGLLMVVIVVLCAPRRFLPDVSGRSLRSDLTPDEFQERSLVGSAR